MAAATAAAAVAVAVRTMTGLRPQMKEEEASSVEGGTEPGAPAAKATVHPKASTLKPKPQIVKSLYPTLSSLTADP